MSTKPKDVSKWEVTDFLKGKRVDVCPFCAGVKFVVSKTLFGTFAVICYECGNRTDYHDSIDEAVAAMNRRPQPDLTSKEGSDG